ncbi:MAG: hypothetical protein COA52_03685 [Hyphomicrobiales bacterium]|nr:hypothetical protein [Hyphomicrobiales bacterium]PCJ95579.1 MAG: hypothetical protein COA52_03685 [Hyphomicrobiales bacterium]
MNVFNRLSGSFLICLLAGTAAFAAPDPSAVADRLIAHIEKNGGTISYEEAIYDAASDEIIISNVTMTNEDDKVNISSISIAGYDESNTSGLTADKLTIVGIGSEFVDGELSVASVTVDDLNVLDFDLNPDDPKTWRGIASGLSVMDILIAPPNKSAVSVARFKATTTVASPDSISGTTTLKIDDIRIPGSLIEGEAKMFFQASGYELLLLDVDIDFNYDAASQSLTLSNLTIDADKMGTLNFSAAFGGIIESMLSDPSQMQGLIATATIKNASLHFTNKSIFDKALEFGAQMMGQDAEQLKEQAPMMLGFGLAQINNEAFSTMVTGAFNTFLDDPKSLHIEIAPTNPVPIAQIGGAAATAPQTVPDLLSISVVANQ